MPGGGSQSGAGGLPADQTAGEWSARLRDLIRVSQVELPAIPQARRTQREFPALNQRVSPSERPKKIRFADIAVIQPILSRVV